MTAVPGAAFLPPAFPPLSPPLFAFPLAYSTLIYLPICSVPFNSKALLNEFFEENLTKANPFGFPSGRLIILTLVTFPHGLNKSLISPSKALKDNP